MTILIGVTGPHSSITREAVRTLLAELNLMHVNLRQPIVDFCATSLNVDAHQLDCHTPLHTHYDDLKMNLREMQQVVQTFLCSANKNYLIDAAIARMEKTERILKGVPIDFIVSNITTETEAAWIRNSGGIMVHVRIDTMLDSAELAEYCGDETIHASRELPPTPLNLKAVIVRINERRKSTLPRKAA